MRLPNYSHPYFNTVVAEKGREFDFSDMEEAMSSTLSPEAPLPTPRLKIIRCSFQTNAAIWKARLLYITDRGEQVRND